MVKEKIDLEIGDILLTRNEGGDEIENPTPGYYNHAAIYIGDNKILEAQAHIKDGKWSSDKNLPGSVILADTNEFINRYPIIKVMRKVNIDKNKIADSKEFVGAPYKRLASFFIFLRKPTDGVNCVSLVRHVIKKATRRDPMWRIPDDISKDINWIKIYETLNY
jgi:hypothetical protein